MQICLSCVGGTKCAVGFCFPPFPFGLWNIKEGSILMVKGPWLLRPASSPALILSLTSCWCSSLSLKLDRISSTWNTKERKFQEVSTMTNREDMKEMMSHKHFDHLTTLRGQTLGDCRHQSSTFAAATVWQHEPDMALRKQPPHHFMKTLRIPDKEGTKASPQILLLWTQFNVFLSLKYNLKIALPDNS